MKKRSTILVSLMAVLAIMFGILSTLFAAEPVAFAADVSYPKQAVNIAAYTTNRNLNLNGTAVNTRKAAGELTENWYIDYVATGVYNIVSVSDGKYLTAGGTSVTVSAKSGSAEQNWKITSVEKDFEGYDLYYKIINASTGTALTYYQGSNAIGLADYNDDGAQKWKLNLFGLEGFAGNAKVANGEKAGTIGGVLGQTVYVSTADDLEKQLNSVGAQTIVITADIDMQKKGNTRIRDNKTIIGSYSKNTIYDSQFRTNDAYGAVDDSPSDNIVFYNLNMIAKNVQNRILINVWSSRQIWVDHCTFNCFLQSDHTGNGQDEVGKFIWINTPYENYMDAKDRMRSPDYVTLSYNIFRNRFWTVAYGTQNSETSRCRTTLMYNWWDQDVRRCPQIGNGNGHIYNNYYSGSDSFIPNSCNQIISGEGSNMVSENCMFQAVSGREIIVQPDTSPYRDSGSYTAKNSSTGASQLNYQAKVTSSWYPNNENYGYSLADAYNNNGTDTKAFCTAYAGAFDSASKIKYITDASMAKFVATKYDSPFLTDKFDSKFGSLVTELKAATLKEGAVYMFKNVNSGLYMEVDSAKAADGTNVQQWGATESASHNTWRVLSAGDGYYYIYSQVGDKISYLLDVASGNADNGTNMNIWSDTKADAQQFKFYQHTDGSYFILTKASKDQSCVAVANASKSAGETVVEWAVNLDDASQKWTLEQVENTGCTMDTSKVYQFKNANSNLYMEVADGAAEDNTNVQQWGADSVAAHNSWTLKEFGGGYYYIISQLSDGKTYYLNSTGGTDGANIEILTNNKTSSHLFKFVKNPDGTYYILTRTSKDAAAVEIANADKASGANVQHWTVNGNACQKWEIEMQTVTTTTISTTLTNTTTTTTTKKVTIAATTQSETSKVTTTMTTQSENTKATTTTTTQSENTKATTTTIAQSETTKATTALTDHSSVTNATTMQSDTANTTKETAATDDTIATTKTMASTEQTTAESGAIDTVLYGDINLDGRINLSDAVQLNKAVAGAVRLNTQAARNADCDGNGDMDVNDSITLMRFLVHLILALPELS